MSEKQQITIGHRAYKYMKEATITSIEDALIELITNADDAYGKSNIKRNKLIEIELHYLEKEHVIVRDHAIGLDFEGMKKSFLQVGNFTSDGNSRGFFSRGAKDITALGDATFTSIKNKKISQVSLDRDSFGQELINNKEVNKEDRDKYKIKENGLEVRLDIVEKVELRKFNYYEETLPKIASLRNIFNSKRNHIIIKGYNAQGLFKETRLMYDFPFGIPVLEVEYRVPKYPKEATAKLTIFKSPKPIDKVDQKRLKEYGFLIASEKVIHDIDTFEKELKFNPDIQYFFGWIHSDYINKLLRDYDSNPNDKLNPMPIIDPNRINGIAKNHPFYRNMRRIVLERLNILLEEIEEDDTTESIMNIDLGEFSDLVSGLNIIDGKLLPDKEQNTVLISNPKSRLAKAIESNRGKWVKVEKNYTLPLKKLKMKPFKLETGIMHKHLHAFHFSKPDFLDEPEKDEEGNEIMDEYSIYNLVDENNKDDIKDIEEKQLYIYDKMADKKSNPEFESQNIANAKPQAEFKLLFKKEPDNNYKFLIKRHVSGVTIKINIGHEVLKEHIQQNEETNINDISPEGIIMIHDILTNAFSRLMIQKEALTNKEMFNGESIEVVEKVFTNQDKKSEKIEGMVYSIIKKLLNKKNKELQETKKKLEDDVKSMKKKIEMINSLLKE